MESLEKYVEVIVLIRKATLEDLPCIMKIVRNIIVEMHSYNNMQWDQSYPQESHFVSDINKGELYVAERNGILAGFICINHDQPGEYEGVPWSHKCPALVIHRMAVASDMRGYGIGSALVNYAEHLASLALIGYLKTDTYSLNANAQKLFEKCGYCFTGDMSFLGKDKPFYCYEKILAIR